MMETIQKQAAQVMEELIQAAGLKAGELLVIGCSSSEVVGQRIGKGSSLEAAEAIWAGIAPVLRSSGVALAVQCCEHLNRALILEQADAERFGYEIVNVRPQPKAGGAFATTVWAQMAHPVAVEHIRAKAGLDIGGTLIGMHLKHVAVPVRLEQKHIGEAILLAARVRPKYIGGERAIYDENLK